MYDTVGKLKLTQLCIASSAASVHALAGGFQKGLTKRFAPFRRARLSRMISTLATYYIFFFFFASTPSLTYITADGKSIQVTIIF
jgi:hypothetical protein